MERLTERNPSWIDDELWESACEPDCEEVDAVYRRLKDYEDLEEQGRLFIRPCNPGDTLYVVDSNRVYTVKAENNVVIISGELNIFVQNTPLFADYVCQSDMGKRAFFTSEEAEAKLKELQNKQ